MQPVINILQVWHLLVELFKKFSAVSLHIQLFPEVINVLTQLEHDVAVQVRQFDWQALQVPLVKKNPGLQVTQVVAAPTALQVVHPEMASGQVVQVFVIVL